MRAVGVHEAKTNLSKLLREVEAGSEVVIMRGGKAVARLVPLQATATRVLGRDRGVVVIGDDFDAPLAVERELHRRLREELHRSLHAPHDESLEVAEHGLGAYVDALDEDAVALVDPDAGVDVRWREGDGWQASGEG